jgi:hypothetical protein
MKNGINYEIKQNTEGRIRKKERKKERKKGEPSRMTEKSEKGKI